MLSGVRGRTAAALALVSVVTLTIVAFALLSPLETRLRTDEIDTLAQAGRDSRVVLARLPSDAFATGDERLARALRSLRRRSLGDVAVVNATGRVLGTTDPDLRERFPDAIDAARTGTASRGIVGSGAENEARVALRVVVDDRPYGVAFRRPLDDVREAAAVVRRAFVVAAGVSLLVALLLGFALSRGLAGRLRALRDTALRVAEIGPVAEIQADRSRDEVGDLTRAFAEMQTRLREQEQARKSFVATASHELRTPLSSLLLMLDLLRADLATDALDLDDARLQAQRAEAQAQRLSSLAGELLDLSRIDAGTPLRSELVELGEVVRSVAAEFATQAHAAGVSLEVQAAGARWAVGDPGAVAQVVRILTDNALRHTAAGTGVTLTATVDEAGATVVVADEGPGVAHDDRERIFERFEHGASDRPSAGFGLGLAIGRELARRMGGDLVLDDGNADRGARFVLRLAAAPHA